MKYTPLIRRRYCGGPPSPPGEGLKKNKKTTISKEELT